MGSTGQDKKTHTSLTGASNTGALRIHSDELNNSTDRLKENETLMRSELMKIYLYLTYTQLPTHTLASKI